MVSSLMRIFPGDLSACVVAGMLDGTSEEQAELLEPQTMIGRTSTSADTHGAGCLFFNCFAEHCVGEWTCTDGS